MRHSYIRTLCEKTRNKISSRGNMPNLKDQLQLIVQKEFNFSLNSDEQKRFDFEIGFLALESIIDRIKSFENKSECMAYLKNLYKEKENDN